MEIRYFKRMQGNEISGIGWVSGDEVMFQDFKEGEYKQSEIGVEEFIKLGGELGFEGMKPYEGVSPEGI